MKTYVIYGRKPLGYGGKLRAMPLITRPTLKQCISEAEALAQKLPHMEIFIREYHSEGGVMQKITTYSAKGVAM